MEREIRKGMTRGDQWQFAANCACSGRLVVLSTDQWSMLEVKASVQCDRCNREWIISTEMIPVVSELDTNAKRLATRRKNQELRAVAS